MMPKNEITIRDMEHGMVDAVAELERLCFSSPWSSDMIIEELENSFARLFVAEMGGKIAGYCGVQLLAGEGYITNVAVHPDWRRLGIGRMLVNRLVELAIEETAEFLTLEVRKSNEAAIGLYQSMGFEEVGVRPGYYSKPIEDALLMTRRF